MAEASDERLWVSDSRAQQIVELDKNGDIIGLIADQGEGPGKVLAPSLIARTPSGDMAVYDVRKRSIEILSPSGGFVRSVRLQAGISWIKGFAVLPSGHFVFSGGIPGVGFSIHLFSPEGKLSRSWDPLSETDNPRAAWIVSGGPLFPVQDGSLLYSRAAPHQIVLYKSTPESPAQFQERTIATDRALLEPMGDEVIVERFVDGELVRSFRGAFPQSKGIFLLTDDLLLNVVVFAEQGKSIWQLYGRTSGHLVAHTEMPVPYVPWDVTQNRDLLVSYPDPDTDNVLAARLDLHYD